MGKIESGSIPGLLTVAAITGDYAAEILVGKEDKDKVGPRLRDRGTDEYLNLAARAEAGMRIIERDIMRLESPNFKMLGDAHGKLRSVHAEAYGWSPPEIPWEERGITTPMRSYIRRWINEWDLIRLYPTASLQTEEESLRPSYLEDTALEEESEVNGSEHVAADGPEG
jgi:hypothetical protein